NYNKIKPLITQRKISQFVNQAVEKELVKNEKQAKAGLREKLIAAHQRMAKNKQLKKELANEWNDLIAVVPMTTDNVDKVEPFEVFVQNTAETGLKEPSKIQLIYPMTIDKELRLVESAQSAPPPSPDTIYPKPAPPNSLVEDVKKPSIENIHPTPKIIWKEIDGIIELRKRKCGLSGKGNCGKKITVWNIVDPLKGVPCLLKEFV
ncbi:31409_t:CDS:2, partial [Racocetra persica]